MQLFTLKSSERNNVKLCIVAYTKKNPASYASGILLIKNLLAYLTLSIWIIKSTTLFE